MADKFEEQLNLIGTLLVQNGDVPDDGILLCAEAERAYVNAAIFKIFDDEILFEGPKHAMFLALVQLWELAPRKKKWWTMQYFVQAGRFEASFGYERVDPEGQAAIRYKAILRERFGNKPVVFPPLDEDYE